MDADRPDVQPEASTPRRTFSRALFIHGLLWNVYERRPTTSDADTRPSLVFETEGIARRIRDYPSNWRELSGSELAALWDRA